MLRQLFLRRNNRRPSTPLERPQQWQRCKVHGCSTTFKNGLDRRASKSFIRASPRSPNQALEPSEEGSFGRGFPSTPRIARRSGQATPPASILLRSACGGASANAPQPRDARIAFGSTRRRMPAEARRAKAGRTRAPNVVCLSPSQQITLYRNLRGYDSKLASALDRAQRREISPHQQIPPMATSLLPCVPRKVEGNEI